MPRVRRNNSTPSRPRANTNPRAANPRRAATAPRRAATTPPSAPPAAAAPVNEFVTTPAPNPAILGTPAAAQPQPPPLQPPPSAAAPAAPTTIPASPASVSFTGVVPPPPAKADLMAGLAQTVLRLKGLASATQEELKKFAGERRMQRTLRLFSAAFEEAKGPEDQEKVAACALRHHIINAPVDFSPRDEQQDPSKIRDWVVEQLNAYATGLGFGEVKFLDHECVVELPSGQKVGLGEFNVFDDKDRFGSEQLLRKIGQAVNQRRFGLDAVIPTLKPFDPAPEDFDRNNALWSAHLSKLAYLDPATIKTQLEAWGFDGASFTWIESAATDTQGFVAADKKGNVYVCFRGTAGGDDWDTDLDAGKIAPGWTGVSGVQVHSGFKAALDSVWDKVEQAVKKAEGSRGAAANVFFAGHSLGGALTSLAALRAAKSGLTKAELSQVYTVGNPRMGDLAFMKLYDELLPRTFRMVNWDEEGIDRQDVVTQIPPRWLGFAHVGILVRVQNKDIHIVQDNEEPDARQRAALTPGERFDPHDPGALEIESMRGASPEQAAQALRAAGIPRRRPLDEEGAIAFRAMPSVSFHNCSEYLRRIGEELLRAITA